MQRPAQLQPVQNIVELPLRVVPLPNAGNDQFSIGLT